MTESNANRKCRIEGKKKKRKRKVEGIKKEIIKEMIKNKTQAGNRENGKVK